MISPRLMLSAPNYCDPPPIIKGQAVRVDKCCTWVQGEARAAPVLLQGQPIPVADTLRQLGLDVAVGGRRTTGPVLVMRLEAGLAVLRRVPHLPAFHGWVRAVRTLVTPLAVHGVAIAPVTDRDLVGLEILVLRA